MDQDSRARKSNIARPLSRLPLVRASHNLTSVHQVETTKQSSLPRFATGSPKKPDARPHGPSYSLTGSKPAFGWTGRPESGVISPSRIVLPTSEDSSLDTKPQRTKPDHTDNKDGEDMATPAVHRKREKRNPRPSLSERTIETLVQISPAPSPSRRRSSTVQSGGSMGPPAHPASALKISRPNTPSTPSSGRAPSPVKRQFRPPGGPASPARETSTTNRLNTIHTPPRAFMRDSSSRIGRPARENRRSISTTANVPKDGKPALQPSNQASKVKSMYNLRAATSRTLTRKPSLPSLAKDPGTPKGAPREPSFRETSPQTSLLKACSPGENVIATCSKPARHVAKTPTAARKPTKPTPIPNQSQKRDSSASNPSKTSAALRDTIAKAKAARRDELRKSAAASQVPDQEWSPDDILHPSGPAICMDTQSLRKKLDGAVITGVLNLSAMSLTEMPSEVLTMYDYHEGSSFAWSEAVDLKKFLMADNDIQNLPDAAFPDWSEQELVNDNEKSNQFGGLEALDLHGNALASIPIGVRRLQQLKVLNLSNNNLTVAMFSTVCELRGLRELRLAKNGLSGTLPEEIGNLGNLQVLDLSDNQLDTLPASISQLENLRKLLLGGNRFNSIPPNVLPTHTLLELDLSKNSFSGTFPTWILQRLPKLHWLDLSFNSIQRLSESILELPALQTFAIHNNRLAALPDITGCVQLTTLTVAENALKEIPQSFYTLMNLRNADFSSNNIKSIDPEIMLMEKLAAFNIGGNPLHEKRYLTMSISDIKQDFARKASHGEPAPDGAAAAGEKVGPDGTAAVDGTGATWSFRPKSGVLDLSSRSLTVVDISRIDLATPIHSIRLANNDLIAFPADLLMHPSVKWNLKSLDMSHNPQLHPTDYLTQEIQLPLLESLYIVSTGLTTLDTLTTYLKAPELKELNISCHRLTGHVPWIRAWYPSTTTLLASDNWFESIDVEAVRGLEVLDIRNNEVAALPPKIGLLGNHVNKCECGKLRSFECSGNRFRVPRPMVVEKGTEAVLRDLRRMIPSDDVPEDWIDEL